MKGLFDTHMQRVRQAVQARNAQIMAVLTPVQRPVFEQMERERQEQCATAAGGGQGGSSRQSHNEHQR